MKTPIRLSGLLVLVLLLSMGAALPATIVLHAAGSGSPTAPAAAPMVLPGSQQPAVRSTAVADKSTEVDGTTDEEGDVHDGNGIVAFSSDAVLKAGGSADQVVAVLGNAISEGTVGRQVVAVLGNARVTGPVGEQVVAVLGNAYVNSAVDKEVVVIGGNAELGPEAKVGQDVVVIGGAITRDPAATVGGRIQNVTLGHFGSLEGLKTWIRRCALLGRPLALDADLGWAWGIAAGFLALYVLLALLAGDALRRCVQILEQRPGRTLLAAVIAIPVVPITYMLLIITVIGLIALPFLSFALLCASLFGKAVMLAWTGHRIIKPLAPSTADRGATVAGQWPVVPAVLLGGAVVTLLYLVPIVGFVVYKVLGFVGFGVVLYTLFDAWQSSHAGKPAADGGAPAVAPLPPATPTPAPAPAEPPQPAAADAPAASAAAAPATGATAAAIAPHAGMPRAGFWLRMGALFLDLLLVLVVSHLLLGGFWHHHDTGSIPLLWLAVYGAAMWKLKGTTIGGSICGLHLVRLDGRPVDWGTAIMRALGCFLSLIVAGLGFVWIAFDPNKQAWHDKVAGTVVVRTPRSTAIV
jgi:uncharacterized RDD family membrane protein YckC